jgi:hypothetical protein
MLRNTFFLCCLVCIVASCSNLNSNQEKNNSTQSVLRKDSAELKTNSGKDYLEIGFNLMKSETIGEIKTGITYERVIELIGKPEEESKVEMSQVDGSYYQSINYSKKGIEIVLVVDSVKKVSNILINKPCSLKTSKQIGIGSSFDEVQNAYKESINPEFSDTESIVVGTVYGGIVFSLENRKVKTIYVGISAD